MNPLHPTAAGWRAAATGFATSALLMCLPACSSSAANSPAMSQAASGTHSSPGAGVSTSSEPSSARTTSGARIGDLHITGAYIPQQASPAVAAAYFTVTNSGPRADTLTKVTTDVTPTVTAMSETDSGTTGSMTDLSEVVIPAHGSFRFTQGHAHLMLKSPDRELKQGDRVGMTLTFAHAGTVRLTLPVVGFTDPLGASASAMPDTSMSGRAMSH